MNHLHLEAAKKIINHTTSIFWFRRDLRLEDNAGLYHALKEDQNVVCIFIFDSIILESLEDKSDRRVDFIHRSLQILQKEIEACGSSLVILHGKPEEIFSILNPGKVYTNCDYEPYARLRDQTVEVIVKEKNGKFNSFKDHVIFEKAEVLKENDKPYTVFTPFSKKWKSTLTNFYLHSYPTKKYFHHFKKIEPLPFPSLQDIGFSETDAVFPKRSIKPAIIKEYHRQRNFPDKEGTSRLSVHLRFGTVSIRKLAQIAQNTNETWLNELIWRDFYQMILWHFPHVEKTAFKPAYNFIEWRNNEHEFEAWCEGRTGYPIVDAGMRELNTTGFMHNRVRMITASFLTKHLLIDYRWGEAYFAKKLIDFDLAANNGGWQWAAGSGCDAAPYFRVFNPTLQQEKFDKNRVYIRKWIPELETDKYPKSIVEHRLARERALRVYKSSLAQPGEY